LKHFTFLQATVLSYSGGADIQGPFASKTTDNS